MRRGGSSIPSSDGHAAEACLAAIAEVARARALVLAADGDHEAAVRYCRGGGPDPRRPAGSVPHGACLVHAR